MLGWYPLSMKYLTAISDPQEEAWQNSGGMTSLRHLSRRANCHVIGGPGLSSRSFAAFSILTMVSSELRTKRHYNHPATGLSGEDCQQLVTRYRITQLLDSVVRTANNW